MLIYFILKWDFWSDFSYTVFCFSDLKKLSHLHLDWIPNNLGDWTLVVVIVVKFRRPRKKAFSLTLLLFKLHFCTRNNSVSSSSSTTKNQNGHSTWNFQIFLSCWQPIYILLRCCKSFQILCRICIFAQ